MNGLDLIAAERGRQVNEEGWTPQHDDDHRKYELSSAACCYVQAAERAPFVHALLGGGPPDTWPFEKTWWKPSASPIDNLVKAGALIAAEIDRLLRLRAGANL